MDYKSLLESWSGEFSSRCSRVRHLISDRHWLSDGRHKEEILADQLSRYVSKKWDLGGGFIIAHDTQISPEIDLHVCNHEKSPPLLAEGSVRIVAAEAVFAFIEVKSTASTSAFGEVAKHQKATLSVLSAVPRAIWSGAFFFSKGKINFERCLQKHIKALHDEGLLTPERRLCFAIADYAIAFVECSASKLRIKLFLSGTLNFPVAICDLLAFLSSDQNVVDGISIDSIVNSLDLGLPTIISL
ncbi:MAG: DUF6602 domain-containing protein [Rhodanobacteraceae bacterium]